MPGTDSIYSDHVVADDTWEFVAGCDCVNCRRAREERNDTSLNRLPVDTSLPENFTIAENSEVERQDDICMPYDFNDTNLVSTVTPTDYTVSYPLPIIRVSKRLYETNKKNVYWIREKVTGTYISNNARYRAKKIRNTSKFKVTDLKNEKAILYLCYYCFQIFSKDKIESLDRNMICSKCKINFYSRCELCGIWKKNGIIKYSKIDRKKYCENCFYRKFSICNNCSKEVLIINIRRFSGSYFCSCCFTELIGRCTRCESLSYKNNLLHYGSNQLLCRNCIENVKTIKRWDYIPKSFKMNKLLWDNNLHMGIELEIETPKEDKRYYDLYAKRIVNFLRRNKLSKYFYLKHDGTIKGFELVSHPMTLAYIHKNASFTKILEWLKKEGFTSYKSGNCGLHVHLNREFLTYKDINKLRLFFSVNQIELSLFSKRAGLNGSFCKYEFLDVKQFLTREKYSNKQLQIDKYYAFRVNPSGKHTVEMRIFRGTLNSDRFLATLQFCDALAHYSKEVSIMSIRSRLSWNSFLMWSKKTCRYNHFINYINNVENLKLKEI